MESIKRPYRQTWTYRELRILQLTARNYIQEEIAQICGIKESTVSWYLSECCRKYGMSKECMAARYALEHSEELKNFAFTRYSIRDG